MGNRWPRLRAGRTGTGGWRTSTGQTGVPGSSGSPRRTGPRRRGRRPRGNRPPAEARGEVSLTLRAFEEDEPGDRMVSTWRRPGGFRQWWLDGANTRPTAEQSRARLEEHMPELVPAWQRLTALLGDDPEAAAALTLWNPPPFLTGCSQAAVLPGGPALVRNYDWDFRLFDAVVARTAYAACGARHVDCLLDCSTGSTTLAWPSRSPSAAGRKSARASASRW